ITNADINRIRSEVIKFLSHGRYPFVWFDSCTRPQHEGGLGVLDPQTQYSLLQTHWILPLLDQTAPLSFTGKLLSYLIRQYCNTSDPLLPLVFPELRSPHISTFSIFLTIFRAMKAIPLSLDWTAINPVTVQELPLKTILSPSHPLPIFASCEKLCICDAFMYDYTTGCIRRTHLHE
ncbi:hypothetical protein CLU79DRAFT_698182, partial [Phycomyces nitens]